MVLSIPRPSGPLLAVPVRYFCCGSSVLHVVMSVCIWPPEVPSPVYGSISFRSPGGAYFWPHLRGIYFLKRYNSVIVFAHSSRTKLTCTKGMYGTIAYRTAGMSDIYVHIFLEECILFYSSLGCTAHQCWPIPQFWFRFNIYLLISSVFLFFPLVTS